MLKGKFPIDKFKELKTPFYYYDVDLLKETLQVVTTESGKYGYHVHYAIKANANPRLLSIIASAGLCADCVSGGEVRAAIAAGFPADKVVFAGETIEKNIRLDLTYDEIDNSIDNVWSRSIPQ